MKKSLILIAVGLLVASCNGQNKEGNTMAPSEKNKDAVEAPKGSWKVDKEFDEHGNLIRYDSIYSWSSNDTFKDVSPFTRDSLMQNFKSKFYSNYSRFENEGFKNMFSQDSLFSKQFFNDDFFGSSFGKDFIDTEKLRQDMLEKQKKFLEKYQSELIKPEDED
ncbi:hypothetical protein [Pseudotamlana carrageenivorans]|uniref:Lipoprotein n=1 Tax=Pseudotamlana carrageenivorans TaxID=2069432 RepID=A0A2I7SL18_9FLAO|nr:hypothetical protein [Tamlana carrageenivorans]AUS06611.1 hypothetical protein C1A40_14695 [Tamlana carrageenivorans]